MHSCDRSAPRLQRQSSRADRGGPRPLAGNDGCRWYATPGMLAGAELLRRLADRHDSARMAACECIYHYGCGQPSTTSSVRPDAGAAALQQRPALEKLRVGVASTPPTTGDLSGRTAPWHAAAAGSLRCKLCDSSMATIAGWRSGDTRRHPARFRFRWAPAAWSCVRGRRRGLGCSAVRLSRCCRCPEAVVRAVLRSC